jgi:acyl-CoA synthetase (AMP-forming)/AMP-acid ligase II
VQVGFTLAQLSLGGTATVLPKFDPLDAVRVMKEQKITWSFMVPFMYNAILSLPEEEKRRQDFEALRFFISAASPLPTGVKNHLLDTFPHVGLHEFYGATEAGVVTNLKPSEQRGKIRCVGKPILDMEVKVLNEMGNEVPAGEVGLLYMRGPTLFNGYYGSPDKTAAAFKDSWCTLGDLARLDDDGYLYIVDRQKDVIKSGGVNIFPAEIEEVLTLHPQVFEAVVVGVPDQKWGEAVHAIVVPKSDHKATPDELLAYCRENLASYKVPKSLEFRSDLPRNPGGKVLKRVLRDEFWENHEVRV